LLVGFEFVVEGIEFEVGTVGDNTRDMAVTLIELFFEPLKW